MGVGAGVGVDEDKGPIWKVLAHIVTFVHIFSYFLCIFIMAGLTVGRFGSPITHLFIAYIPLLYETSHLVTSK